MSKYVISMCDGESHEVIERYDEDIFDTYEEAESTRDEWSAGYANGAEIAEERGEVFIPSDYIYFEIEELDE